MNRTELIKKLGFCVCHIASPSSYSDICLNEGCKKVIKNPYETIEQLKTAVSNLLEWVEHTGEAKRQQEKDIFIWDCLEDGGVCPKCETYKILGENS